MPFGRRFLATGTMAAFLAGLWASAATAEMLNASATLRVLAPRVSPLDDGRPKGLALKGEKSTRSGPLAETRSTIVPFSASPFPFTGEIPKIEKPFLDVAQGGRRGHTSVRAGVYWEDETYSDRSVLLAFPKGFDIRRPAVMVVFLHGNNALLSRDVVARQQVLDQVAASGLNAVLVAPQLAHDAQDSSAGNFWRKGYFARFLKEAAGKLAKFYGGAASASEFERMPVILVAYSGGYNPAAYALAVGEAGRRIRGVILLDALYGEEDKFVDWIRGARKSAFFFSAYSLSSAGGNNDVAGLLKAGHVAIGTTAPKKLFPGTVTFIAATDPAIVHDDFVTAAWVPEPLKWTLSRVPGFPR